MCCFYNRGTENSNAIEDSIYSIKLDTITKVQIFIYYLAENYYTSTLFC